MTWLTTVLAMSAAAAHAAVVEADSARGAALFQSLACVQCHSVNGEGGRTGPDLGRLVDRDFTPAALAATMWNHAPTMWASMRANAIRSGDLDEQGAADLFAYFYSTRFFERPGDAARGKRVLERGCARCHGLTSPVEPGAPPVSQWTKVNTPFELVAAMWNHLPRMRAAAVSKGVVLPQLSAQDFEDLLVYVRHLPGLRSAEAGFRTTSGTEGQALFKSKGCGGCHQTGSVLGSRIQGKTLTEIAAGMWNHGPSMSAAGAPPTRLEPDEMRELLSYLWARQFFEGSGDAARGRRVFSAKGCAGCHANPASGAPPLPGSGRRFSGAFMVSALWRHGPAMLESMRAKGTPWPRFDGREMSDVIAYLNAGSGSK
jgi:mono/diheme cytochrome c family protein